MEDRKYDKKSRPDVIAATQLIAHYPILSVTPANLVRAVYY